MEDKPPPNNSNLEKVFAGLAKLIREDFDATNIDNGFATSRTGTNREFLVIQFFQATLPLSFDVRLGATLGDALGQISRDVDIVLLNPWASPIWPLEHGIVPVEGVLTAVFIENKCPPPESLWRQCASAKSLLRSIRPPGDYAAKIRSTFRVETAVWFWSSSEKIRAENVLDDIMKHKNLFDEEIEKSFTMAKEKKWVGYQPDGKTDSMEDEKYKLYQTAVGSPLPNWIYLHGSQSTESLLMSKIQIRHRLRNGKWEKEVPRNAAELELVNPEPNGFVFWEQENQKCRLTTTLDWRNCMWAYAFYNDPDPLRVLALQLSHGTTLYGQGRIDYGAYL